MGRLTGSEIIHQVQSGEIVIDPLVKSNVGPNSVDLRLSSQIAWYRNNTLDPRTKEWLPILDMKEKPLVVHSYIPKNGFVMEPGKLYLGMTKEVAGSHSYVPGIEGRSSVARFGIQVHMTAGFGDVGFVNRWTLEMTCVDPVRIYPGVRICQIYFDEPVGRIIPYRGKYMQERSTEPVESRMWRDFEEK